MADTDDTATLRYPGGEIDLNIVHATEGSDGIALGPLLAKTGYTTFDQGFVNTAATKSAITYIDGDAGILRYRGYPIEQLAEHSSYLEVAYLLIHGELPTPEQFEDWRYEITHHTFIHENVRKRFMEGFHHDAHPMGMLISTIAACGSAPPGTAPAAPDTSSVSPVFARPMSSTPKYAVMPM